MKHSYTKEFKQPARIYFGGKIPILENGIDFVPAVIMILIATVVIGLTILGMLSNIPIISTVFKNGFTVILVIVMVATWVLFKLKWDNKDIFSYLYGRIFFKRKQSARYEHGYLVATEEHMKYKYGHM